jgi:hypothetical protein
LARDSTVAASIADMGPGTVAPGPRSTQPALPESSAAANTLVQVWSVIGSSRAVWCRACASRHPVLKVEPEYGTTESRVGRIQAAYRGTAPWAYCCTTANQIQLHRPSRRVINGYEQHAFGGQFSNDECSS